MFSNLCMFSHRYLSSLSPTAPNIGSPYVRCNPGSELGDLTGKTLKFVYEWYLDGVLLNFSGDTPQDLPSTYYQFRPESSLKCHVSLAKISRNPNEGTIYDGE